MATENTAQSASKRSPLRLVFFILILAFLAISASWYFLWRIPSANTPEEAVERLIAAWQVDNERLADSYFSVASKAELDRVRTRAVKQGWRYKINQVRWFKDESKVNTVWAHRGKATITGNRAIVPVSFTVPASSRYPRRIVRMKYYCVKEGNWKVHGWTTIGRASGTMTPEEKKARTQASKLWDDLVKETAKSRRKP